ncbi:MULTISPECIES: hypothetical protein [Streptomyces]|uniref:hypothetical protein n=1 Tax=Streptomyces TaxID=1883 RepID=UPI0005CB59D9|nr:MULTISPECIES: hypothetical protein [Streptomyces]AWL85929.1 hypothetical protein DIJ69_08190 [Streptomyces globisporus]PPA39734.1 hypothetical protein BF14_008215 [Streptomyces griseus]RAN24981.1 hypothetical protein A3800_08035 [Streptomyces badius]UIZ15647.1 hypothetical protein LZ559_26305 [Streptomyces sp. R527F]
MNTTPSKTTNPDETAAADAAATKGTETKDAPGTSSKADDSATASDDLATRPEDDAADEGIQDEDLEPDPFERARHGVGAGAAAVVSAALGVVALTGAWSGRVAAERETLIGQIKTSGGGSAAQQISEIYGDAWHTTALVNGVFALLALLVGVVVLVRPAFGAPADRPQPAWVRAVALAGVALGVLGVLISAGMYFDLFASLPSAGTPAAG